MASDAALIKAKSGVLLCTEILTPKKLRLAEIFEICAPVRNISLF